MVWLTYFAVCFITGIDGDPHSTPVTSTRRNTTCATCERISHIENWCKGRPTPNKLTSVTWRNLYLDHHHKLLFCEVPKAGASTMKRILIRASPLHSTQDSDPEWDAHKDLKKFNITHPTPYFNDLKKYLNGSYFKFILVRHPMSRLLSAYKDKFYDSVFLPKTSQYILRNYRNKSSGWDGFNPNKDYVRSNPVTWQEFTDFVAAEYPNGSDRHWKTVQELCSPCLIHYDAILKLETIEDDMEVISKHLGGNRVQIPTENMSKGMKGKTFRSFFEELSSDVINGLKKVYADDMTAFGYTFDDNLLPKYVNSSSQC